MLNTVRGVVKDGKIELLEQVELPEGTDALVTLLPDEAEFWSAVGRPSLDAIWDNTEDDVYAELLEE
jgi:hypothetical protein